MGNQKARGILIVEIHDDLYVEDVLEKHGIDREEFDKRISDHLKHGRITLEPGERTKIVASREKLGSTFALVGSETLKYFAEVSRRVRRVFELGLAGLYGSYEAQHPESTAESRQIHLIAILTALAMYPEKMLEIVLEPEYTMMASALYDYLEDNIDLNSFESIDWIAARTNEDGKSVTTVSGAVVDGKFIPQMPGPDGTSQ